MKNYKCPKCGGPTEKIWENTEGTKYGMRCIDGHKNTSNKSDGSKQYTVIIVPSEELTK
jgi:hypothetical protein